MICLDSLLTLSPYVGDLRPEQIAFSNDGKQLYVTAEENGRGKLFTLPASPHHAKELPTTLINDGSVSAMSVLPNGHIFISSSSLVDNSTYCIILAPSHGGKSRSI